MQRHVAAFDVHAPRNINLEPLMRFNQVYKPDHFIIGGDFLNLEWASHWNERAFKDIGLAWIRKNLEEETKAGKRLLKELKSSLPKHCKISYIPGNHESWLYWVSYCYGIIDLKLDPSKLNFKSDLAQAMNESLKRILTTLLETEALGIQVLPYNKFLEIGHITYSHGHQFSLRNSTKLFPSKNMVFGHWHTEDRKTLHNSGEKDKTFQHTAVPCLTPLGPGYLKSPSTRWLNGFWIADVLDNGLFDGRVVKILDGKTIGPRI